MLNEAFVDYRTRAALRVNAQGQTVAVTETVETSATPIIIGGDGSAGDGAGEGQGAGLGGAVAAGTGVGVVDGRLGRS